jgi:DNA-binding transcriptional MocR family regulator
MDSKTTPLRKPGGLAVQLVNALTEQIRSGRLQAGNKLPTEAAIMQDFGVSRTVVREAISRLQASGWVDTRGSALGENTYGMFSARIQLPREAVGVWPAYWLVDDNNHCWPTGGEIDILEAVGGVQGDSVSGTLHWGQSCGEDDWEGDGQRSGHFPHPPGAP